ncbi:aminopeptidase N [Telmatospirillum sp. J64-1]|uniref:aminopeptidase N n=1 Tax=Telmatospirillum sp. J64-1 TaxID=2502183 RepID=UPI00115DEFE1|nr:aminopeptidase N [Telmatospirillum sp. J64-1]
MTEQPRAIRLQDYRRPDYDVETVDLTFDLVPDATRVKSALRLVRRTEGDAPLVLDGDELKLVAISLDGRKLAEDEYSVQHGCRLVIPHPPASFTLEVETEISPRSNTKLSGLYVSNGTFCTQCEAEGFRRITFFPDRPDVMAVYTVTIRASRSLPVLLSNGNLVEQGELEDGRHFAVWHDPFPKPSYLFALVAGDLALVEDRFVTASGREVALRIWVEHGNEDRCGYAMDSLKRAMRWDEERFGLEYDLDVFNIVAVSDFNMGAMENKSLNVFNDKYILADPQTATDQDYELIEGIVAHEYFHNWTGNRVTCRDWFQLSLKEGLTVFRDEEFSSDQRSRPVKRIQTVRNLRARQFVEDAGPLKHPVRPDSYIEINNFYTATVYEKGGQVIGMLQTILGREGFRKGMDLYFQRHDGQAVTCEDFVAAMADANGVDLSQFFRWYTEAGTPEVIVKRHWDEAAKALELTLEQRFPAELDIPLSIGLLDSQGRDMATRLEGESEAQAGTRVLRLNARNRNFRFVDLPEAPIPSLNRHFSAPVTLRVERSDEELRFLMGNDTDPFARWEAGQQYAVKLLLGTVASLRNGEFAPPDPAFADALLQSLDDAGLDKAFVAQMMHLPSEDFLAEQMEVIDIDAIHQAREALRRSIAQRLKGRLLEVYHANQSNEPYSPDAASAGRRALKNAALSYLALLSDPAMLDLVVSQYNGADNMTDRMAALWALNDSATTARDQALDDFYVRFSDNPLVIDKWLGLQAMAPLPDTLDTVRGLMNHPAFSIRNPNKVRALIGSFANGNPVCFHAPDGSGYAFLADRIIDLDGLNPQVAARLVAPLGRWRRFDQARQHLMREQLRRILAKPGLSRDVYELASKSLGED